jgi:hypothetical protein
MAFNGEFIPKNIVAFYSFAYRAAHRFDSTALHGQRERVVPEKFWSAFFKGASSGGSGGQPRRRSADLRTPP